MRINQDTVIEGARTLLVPYRQHHVEKYHEWMKDPTLQDLTESEPLTLKQEYEMCESWREDPEKCTFIIIDKSVSRDHVVGMVGDVNLYFNDPEEPKRAEIEVMVAEVASRRKGIAGEALELMMCYAIRFLSVSGYIAKILEKNEASISLFSRLHFRETKRVKVFREVHMELCSKTDVAAWTTLIAGAQNLMLQNCPQCEVVTEHANGRL